MVHGSKSLRETCSVLGIRICPFVCLMHDMMQKRCCQCAHHARHILIRVEAMVGRGPNNIADLPCFQAVHHGLKLPKALLEDCLQAAAHLAVTVWKLRFC
ncbi:hypothetical protein ABBQ38_013590 [Trebouxia sp. C0009 RCD-2024]